MTRVCMVFLGVCLLLGGTGCGRSGVAAQEASERNSPLYRKAFAAEQTGDIDEAIRLYNEILIDEPRSFSAHFQLATLLHDHKEDYIGAIYHYNQYLYLRPDSDKSTLAKERVRIAEQLLAPQILRKVGDSVQGLSQAHLLQENDRLNRLITSLEGEKSVLVEAKSKTDKDVADLQSENARLRGILSRMRAEETSNEPSASLLKRVEAAVRKEEAPAPAKTDAKDIKALREEAAAISSGAPTEIPSTETLLKKVQSRLSESDTSAPPPVVPDSGKEEKSGKLDRTVLSGLSPFGTKKNKEKTSSEPRTYVVQPGDSLFRVAERFYGDSTQWKRIRDANKAGIDPDGRIRAGQIIVVP